MRQVTKFPEASLKFAARVDGFNSPRAVLRRWQRDASAAAIARTLSDLRFNPFLFQIESED
jgi:hypothetical protein